jgi:hypothetical protein
MSFLKPWLWYLLCALIMCIIYCGLEKANGGLGMTTKSILCSWSIISCIVTVALFGLQTSIDISGKLPPFQVAGGVLAASCVTLSISSCCIYCAA